VTWLPVPTVDTYWPRPADGMYIMAGPDGAIWFTENVNKIGRIS
jgi:hypothetical protein